jgi:hypothetical protein
MSFFSARHKSTFDRFFHDLKALPHCSSIGRFSGHRVTLCGPVVRWLRPTTCANEHRGSRAENQLSIRASCVESRTRTISLCGLAQQTTPAVQNWITEAFLTAVRRCPVSMCCGSITIGLARLRNWRKRLSAVTRFFLINLASYKSTWTEISFSTKLRMSLSCRFGTRLDRDNHLTGHETKARQDARKRAYRS